MAEDRKDNEPGPVRAIVLSRDPVDLSTASVLFPTCDFETFIPRSGPPARFVESAFHLGLAVKQQLAKCYPPVEISDDIFVFAQDPRQSGTNSAFEPPQSLKPNAELLQIDISDAANLADFRSLGHFCYVLVARVPPEEESVVGSKRARAGEFVTFADLNAHIRAQLHEIKHEEYVASVVVPSHDLQRVANERGATARTFLHELDLQPQPANQTVKMTLGNETYHLGFCRLPSEKSQVQPLLTQLLEKVAKPYKYTTFDVHNKQTNLFGHGLPDNLLVRNEGKPVPAGTTIPDVVNLNPAEAIVEGDGEQVVEGPADEPEIVDPGRMGINPNQIGVIVEGKPYRKADTPESHLELLTYMRNFLVKHPFRQQVVGMLTDLQIASFYMLRRDPGDRAHDHLQSQVKFLGQYTGVQILQVLRMLLSGNGEVLDDEPVRVKREGEQVWSHVELVQRLGRGGFGRVLHVKMNNEDFAMKLPFHSARVQTETYNPNRELRMTNEVASKNKNVPQSVFMVQAWDKRQLLLMAPVGVPHSRHNWTKLLMLDLLTGMFELQAQTQSVIVHRDVRPSNIILARDDQHGERLVLIDWGCAVEQGTEVQYAGSMAYAAHRLYSVKATDVSHATKYVAHCADDFGSFVLTAAATFFMRDGAAERCNAFDGFAPAKMRSENWLSFWEQRLPDRWWRAYNDVSANITREANYEIVRALLDEALPLRPMWS